MNKLKFLMVFVCVTLVFPMVMRAQTNVLHRVFAFSSEIETGLMDDDDDFTFVNCYAIRNNPLQVGSGSGNSLQLGSVTTRALGLNGNATVLLKVKGSSGVVNYKVSIDGIVEYFFSTVNNEESHPDAIFIQNGKADTRIKIEGVNGKFDLISLDVYDIGAGIFYESFNYMEGKKHEDFSANGNASLNNADNYTGGAIEFLTQVEGCVYFRDNDVDSNDKSKYITPSIPVVSGGTALLTFKLSKQSMNSTPVFKITCSGGAKFGLINTYEVSNVTECSITNACYPTAGQWSDYYVLVSGTSSDIQLTFMGEYVYLDDVKLTPYAVLDEGADNASTITNNQGSGMVTLTRTLGAGYWNTLCLPFDITKASFEEATGANAEIQTLASVNNGVFRFDDIAADATIEAGTPFIVKVSRQVTNPQFRNVVITDTEAKAMPENESYQFVGTYSPVQLEIDKKELFLGTDGKLHYPSSAEVSTMKGLRAYFVVPTGAVTTRVNINGEEMDAIDALDAPEADAVVYDLRGQRHHLDDLQMGVYICDGRKVIVK